MRVVAHAAGAAAGATMCYMSTAAAAAIAAAAPGVLFPIRTAVHGAFTPVDKENSVGGGGGRHARTGTATAGDKPLGGNGRGGGGRYYLHVGLAAGDYSHVGGDQGSHGSFGSHRGGDGSNWTDIMEEEAHAPKMPGSTARRPLAHVHPYC